MRKPRIKKCDNIEVGCYPKASIVFCVNLRPVSSRSPSRENVALQAHPDLCRAPPSPRAVSRFLGELCSACSGCDGELAEICPDEEVCLDCYLVEVRAEPLQIRAHRPHLRLLLASLERNSRHGGLPRLAVQIVCRLGRQIHKEAAMAYRSPHRNPGADAYLRRGLLIRLRAGRRGQGREDIQRPRRGPRDLQLCRILHHPPPNRNRQRAALIVPGSSRRRSLRAVRCHQALPPPFGFIQRKAIGRFCHREKGSIIAELVRS